jgi:hypothetical protein
MIIARRCRPKLKFRTTVTLSLPLQEGLGGPPNGNVLETSTRAAIMNREHIFDGVHDRRMTRPVMAVARRILYRDVLDTRKLQE